jgi:acyl-CoA thioesterase II
MPRIWRDNGLSIVVGALFVLSLVGQSVAGHRQFNDDRRDHDEPTLDFGAYLASSEFLEATMENWESEFLQMGMYVVLTAMLVQKGSAESKDPEKREPVRHMWLRAVDRLPDDQMIHQAVLAYASDHGLLGTALLPHGIAPRSPNLQLATLDLAFWAHRPFRAVEWLLYAMDSPAAAGARGFTRGSFYTRDGVLVASTAQEGLMRKRESET